MFNTRQAKLFKNGSSQAVRLPADFRFDGGVVYISRNDETGDVILSMHPGAKVWSGFFDLLREIDVPQDFMDNRPMNKVPENRNLFDE
jgi:antitoxin VapB